jgi:hypothetical protein
MKNNIGIFISYLIAFLVFASGLNPPNSHMNSGIVIFLGTLIYSSAKKRNLNIELDSKLRRAIELIILVLIVLFIICQNNYLYLLQTEPIDNFIIPLAVVIFYLKINASTSLAQK